MELESTVYFDCGNTRVKYCHQDDYGVLAYDQIPAFIADCRPSEIVYSSVTGERLSELSAAADSAVNLRRCIVEQHFAGLKLSYRDISALGVDRWLAMLKARDITGGGPVWVVDAGTALTVDCIDSDNYHVGGLIAPGISMSARSLFNETVDLPHIKLKHAGQLGTDTHSCINYGVLHSAVALIEATVERFKIGCENLIITGGDAEMVCRHLTIPHEHQPNLVIDGLKLYWALKRQGEF